MLVEEPTGTVCSLRNPRTTAGGILLGDDIRQTGGDSFGGHSQVYVCPKGFDGKYRMLVRRVWGNVTAGKVNVEVVTHCNTPKAIDVRKKIALDKDEAVVAFDLKDGRRKEALRDQQVANIVDGQLALNRQILAQQLAASIDSQSLLNLASAAGERRQRRGLPFFGGGAVGYQPVITTCPKGAMSSGDHGRRLGRPQVRPHHRRPVLLRRVAGQHLQHGQRREPHRKRAAPATPATAASSAAPATAAAPAGPAAESSDRRWLHPIGTTLKQQSIAGRQRFSSQTLRWRLRFLLLAVALGVRADGPPRFHQSR